jgi:dTDP-4-amino-4,6-dideoxygalactose transaminase
MGDAGAVITNDHALAEKMAMFARHGGLKKGDHKIEGINSRLDGLQAAILSVKLPHLQKWTGRRQSRAGRYSEGLSAINEVKTPEVAEGREHVWHLYVIKSSERDGLANFLSLNGVQTVINYPVALPFLPAYRRYNHQHSEFPNAFRNQSKILSLPIYPELNDAKIDDIVNLIGEYSKGAPQ